MLAGHFMLIKAIASRSNTMVIVDGRIIVEVDGQELLYPCPEFGFGFASNRGRPLIAVCLRLIPYTTIFSYQFWKYRRLGQLLSRSESLREKHNFATSAIS